MQATSHGTTALPKISIVTPSFNQGAYLEQCIRSVLDQDYPNLEYIVVDGGSNDGSREILCKYQSRFAYCVSEPDGGHYDALNKGFAQSTGEIMAWLNSDDRYLPSAFSVVAEVFSAFPEVEWLTTTYPVLWNERDQTMAIYRMEGYHRESFRRGGNLPDGVYARGWIQQESTFWRRSLWERAGGFVDKNLKLGSDFELWTRFYQHAELYAVGALLGGFRRQNEQKTAKQYEEYVDECKRALHASGGRPYGPVAAAFRRYVMPRIAFLARRVPGTVALGMFYPAKVIRYSVENGCWLMGTELIF